MKLTDILAVYGAALSTLLAIWTIGRTVWTARTRITIKLSPYDFVARDATIGAIEAAAISITNHSDFEINVESAGVQPDKYYRHMPDMLLYFSPTENMRKLGFASAFTVRPRETKRALAPAAHLVSSFKRDDVVSVIVRPFVKLGDGRTRYGRWEKVFMTGERIYLDEKPKWKNRPILRWFFR